MPNNNNNNYNTSSDENFSPFLKDNQQYKRSVEYNIVMEKLESLSIAMKLYSGNDADGYSRTLSDSDYDYIMGQYRSLQDACKKYIDTNHASTSIGTKKQLHIVKEINNIATKDMAALNNADRKQKATLQEIIKKGRVSNITLARKDVNLNKEKLRVQLVSASGTKGVFTQTDTNKYQHNSVSATFADLLGQGKLYGKLTSARISVNGKDVEGVFHCTVEGENLRHLSKDSPVLNSDINDADDAEVLRQIADIQLIDYICQNPQRHPDSVAYRFEKDEHGTTRLKGVTVINDFAPNEEITPNPTQLSDIKAISSSSYQALMDLDESAISIIFADKLKPEEIKALCKRVEDLKKEIEKENIKVVEDKKWGIHPILLMYLASKGKGFCFDMYTFYRELTMRKLEKMTSIVIPETETVSNRTYVSTALFTGGKSIDEETSVHLSKDAEKFSDIKDKMDKLPPVSPSEENKSKEFDELCKAIKDVEEFSNILNSKTEKLQAPVTEAEYEALQKYAEAVSEKSLAYINSLEGKTLTEEDKKRLEFAQGIASGKGITLGDQTSPATKANPEPEPKLEDDAPELVLTRKTD